MVTVVGERETMKPDRRKAFEYRGIMVWPQEGSYRSFEGEHTGYRRRWWRIAESNWQGLVVTKALAEKAADKISKLFYDHKVSAQQATWDENRQLNW